MTNGLKKHFGQVFGSNTPLCDPTIEEQQNFLNHAKSMFRYINENDKHVMLLIDEIHIKPYMDYKASNVVGTACNNTSLATTAYVFMVTRVRSSF